MSFLVVALMAQYFSDPFVLSNYLGKTVTLFSLARLAL